MSLTNAVIQILDKLLEVVVSAFVAKPNAILSAIWGFIQRAVGLRHEGMYEVLEFDTKLVLHDPQGKDATYYKHQRVRFLQNNVIAYQDQAWGDGDIFADYKCSPGVAVDRYREGHRYHILISLRKTMNRDDQENFHIERRIHSGFTKPTEDLQIEVNHPTRKLTVSVIFPQERLPKRCWLVEENTHRTHALDAANFTTLPDKRVQASWHTGNPRQFEAYILMWEW